MTGGGYSSVDGWACDDCTGLIANGAIPDRFTETETAAWLADIDRRQGAGRWGYGRSHGVDVDGCGVNHGEDHDGMTECETITFSGRPCDCCGSTLGGYRFAVHWFVAGGAVTCDGCGGPVDGIDGWTDGSVALCGSFRGNGCDAEMMPEAVG